MMDQMNHKQHMTSGSMGQSNLSMHSMGGNNCSMMMMMMPMYFQVGSEVTFLFENWKTTNAGEMFGTCVFLFVLGVFYEGLKSYRQYLLLNPPTKLSVQTTGQEEGVNKNIDNLLMRSGKEARFINTRFTLMNVIQSALHMIQVFIGYVLMLAFMTYNAWLCIAVILGAGLGNFIFASNPVVFNSGDHCN